MYVGNNPCNHTDPDGHCFPVCTAIAGLILGGIAGGLTYSFSEHQIGEKTNGGDLFAAIAMGALAGGLIGSGVGATVGSGLFVAGMSGSAMGTALAVDHYENIKYKENFSAKEHVLKGGLAAVVTATSTTAAGGLVTAGGTTLTAANLGISSGVLSFSIIGTYQSMYRRQTYYNTGKYPNPGENPFGEPIDAVSELIPSVGDGPIAEFLSRTAVGIGVSNLNKSSQNSSASTSPSQPTSARDVQRERWLMMHNER